MLDFQFIAHHGSWDLENYPWTLLRCTWRDVSVLALSLILSWSNWENIISSGVNKVFWFWSAIRFMKKYAHAGRISAPFRAYIHKDYLEYLFCIWSFYSNKRKMLKPRDAGRWMGKQCYMKTKAQIYQIADDWSGRRRRMMVGLPRIWLWPWSRWRAGFRAAVSCCHCFFLLDAN